MSVSIRTVMSTGAPSGCTERCKTGMYALIGRKVDIECSGKVVCWSRVDITSNSINGLSTWPDAREARIGVTFE